MTEIERLISEGKVPKEYFIPEERCGYEITVEDKKIYALQLDLVKQVEEICARHGLKYFAVGGTAIGAIRHKGMIPWDDDLDIALLREEYDEFVRYAQEELTGPYFLQSPETDPYFFRHHVLLRNSNTTCIGKWDRYLKCNNGVYIDIFPLDGYEDNEECNRAAKLCKRMNQFGMNNYRWRSATNKKTMRILLRAASFFRFPGGSKQIFRQHEKLCRMLSAKYSEKVGIQYTNFMYKADSLNFLRDWFCDSVRVPYEFTDICVPVGCDLYLKRQFGDYMSFPPVESRGNRHLLETDIDTPYREYCSKKYGVKY